MEKNIKKPDGVFLRESSPFLAATPGYYHFFHSSQDRINDITKIKIDAFNGGTIEIPTGELVIADAFQGLQQAHNPRLKIKPGTYNTMVTTADLSHDLSGKKEKFAYFTIIIDEELFAERWEKQIDLMEAGHNPNISPENLLMTWQSYLPPPGWTEEETVEKLEITTGAMAVLDLNVGKKGLPPNIPEKGMGWYETLFEHGVPRSWFDAMDSNEPYKYGYANFYLPNLEHLDQPSPGNVILCRTGGGDGSYYIYKEMLSTNNPLEEKLIALHVDFQVIPKNPRKLPHET